MEGDLVEEIFGSEFFVFFYGVGVMILKFEKEFFGME